MRKQFDAFLRRLIAEENLLYFDYALYGQPYRTEEVCKMEGRQDLYGTRLREIVVNIGPSLFAELTPSERVALLSGLSAEERFDGLSAEERVIGLRAEERTKLEQQLLAMENGKGKESGEGYPTLESGLGVRQHPAPNKHRRGSEFPLPTPYAQFI